MSAGASRRTPHSDHTNTHTHSWRPPQQAIWRTSSGGGMLRSHFVPSSAVGAAEESRRIRSRKRTQAHVCRSAWDERVTKQTQTNAHTHRPERPRQGQKERKERCTHGVVPGGNTGVAVPQAGEGAYEYRGWDASASPAPPTTGNAPGLREPQGSGGRGGACRSRACPAARSSAARRTLRSALFASKR